MKDYKELIRQLRFLSINSEKRNIFDEAADAFEELLKDMEKINHLQDSQHYSGRYIKSIMGVKDDEQTTDEGD